MLKNKKIIIFSILILGLIILSVQGGMCAGIADNQTVTDTALAQNMTVFGSGFQFKTDSLNSVIAKFMITMGAVIVSLLLIGAGLCLYKNFLSKNTITKKNLLDDKLNSPNTIDEAVAFFINKNRLK